MFKMLVVALCIALGTGACTTQGPVGNTPPGGARFAVFEMIDQDHSRSLSDDEWRRAVATAAAPLPAGPATYDYRCQLIRLFERLDVDRDEQLSRTEWETGKFETFSPCS
jgi:hypothetical protein